MAEKKIRNRKSKNLLRINFYYQPNFRHFLNEIPAGATRFPMKNRESSNKVAIGAIFKLSGFF
jgi:hypothetical protein